MAAITGTLLSLILCMTFGQFSLAILIAGLLCVVGLKFSFCRKLAVFIFLTTLSLTIMISSRSDWAVVLPALVVFISNVMINSCNNKGKIWIIFLPIVSFV